MTFLQGLKQENNKTQGWNGANGFKSTMDANLDLYTRAGTMRFSDSRSIVELFHDALVEDKELAMKNLFFIRDVRGGMGERKVFDDVIEHLVKNDNNLFKQVVHLIPEYGSYGDLRKIVGNPNLSSEEVKEATKLMISRLKVDVLKLNVGEKDISLCAKWMPTVGSKNPVHKLAISRLLKEADLTEKSYRKVVSALRAELNLVETKLTKKQTDEIDYSQVPSQAFKKYTGAFFRNDEERFEEFLNKANEGEVKVNASTIHANQLVAKYMYSRGVDKAIEAQWKNLPELDNKAPNVLSMVDVSGSMTGTPMEVAVALGVYLSEQTEGAFKDNFLTFSQRPELVSLENETTLHDKVQKTMRSDWGMNTNLEAAFDMILNTAVRYNLPQEDLPEILFVLSDMQMDGDFFGRAADITFLEGMKQKFESHGYKIPHITWWNISNSSSGALPVTKFEKNVSTLSGFSQSLFNTILNLDMDALENYTPASVMLETLNGERYSAVSDALK